MLTHHQLVAVGAGRLGVSLATLASVRDMVATANVAIRVAAASRGDAAVRARARSVSSAGVVRRPASLSTTRGRRDRAVAFGALADAAESCDEACTWEQLEHEVTEEIVANVMRVDVTACRADDTVLAALETLVSNRISGVPVVDDDGVVVGVISEYDLLVRLGSQRAERQTMDDGMFPPIGRCDEFGGSVKDMWGRFLDLQERADKANGETVEDAMGEARTVAPGMKLADATDVMLNERLTRLVVVDDEEKLVGVLSRGDIIRRTYEAFRRGVEAASPIRDECCEDDKEA